MNKTEMKEAIKAVRPVLHADLEGEERGPVVVVPLAALMENDSLTRERIRVLLELREHGAAKSVKALAKRVNRSEARVSQDVKALVKLHLARRHRHGARMQIEADERPILLA